jgi:hypothetical protein|tara:strand:- start:145 stop:357 length:213 start_codon:yes stop_codon:yes gene_type:complete
MKEKLEKHMYWLCFIVCTVLIVVTDFEWLLCHPERTIGNQLHLHWIEYTVSVAGVLLTAPYICKTPKKKG